MLYKSIARIMSLWELFALFDLFPGIPPDEIKPLSQTTQSEDGGLRIW